MATKAQTCVYNANRHAHKIALAYCKFVDTLNIKLPPHVYIETRYMDDTTCSRCKCHSTAVSSKDVPANFKV